MRAKRVVRERWEVEWYELTAKAEARRNADLDTYEHDRDADEEACCQYFKTKEAAQRYARKVVDSRKTVYGYATVTHQRVMPVPGTTLEEWDSVDEPEYVE